MSTPTIDVIRDEVRALAPALSERDQAFTTALILLSALVVGPNDQAVADFTGLSLSTVQKRTRNLRAGGLWGHDGKIHADWFDEETGGISFWLDVAVADGLMVRE